MHKVWFKHPPWGDSCLHLQEQSDMINRAIQNHYLSKQNIIPCSHTDRKNWFKTIITKLEHIREQFQAGKLTPLPPPTPTAAFPGSPLLTRPHRFMCFKPGFPGNCFENSQHVHRVLSKSWHTCVAQIATYTAIGERLNSCHSDYVWLWWTFH